MTVGDGKQLTLDGTGSKWWYEKADSTLTAKVNGAQYRATAQGDYRSGQQRKWNGVGLEAITNSQNPDNANAQWRIEYCHTEHKPNPSIP